MTERPAKIASELFFGYWFLWLMRPPTRPSSKGSSLTHESSSKAQCSFTDPTPITGRGRHRERPEVYAAEPPASSSRTRVARVESEAASFRPPAPDADDPPPCSSRMTMEAWAAMNAELGRAPDECVRTRLIGELTRILREPAMPEATRTAGLTLIGWLARRMPGEAPHALGAPRDTSTGSGNATTGAAAKRPPSDAPPRSARGASMTSVTDRRTGKR